MVAPKRGRRNERVEGPAGSGRRLLWRLAAVLLLRAAPAAASRRYGCAAFRRLAALDASGQLRRAACVEFRANGSVITVDAFSALNRTDAPQYAHYEDQARHLLGDVVKELSKQRSAAPSAEPGVRQRGAKARRAPGMPVRLGSAVIMPYGDDASLSLEWNAALCQARAPLLSHASRKSMLTDAILIPDWIFIADRGFSHTIRHLRKMPPFERRRADVFWRGSTTGPVGFGSFGVDSSKLGCDGPDPESALRVRLASVDVTRVKLARKAKGHPWLDVELVQMVQLCQGDEARLRAEGLVASKVADTDWALHRGILEVDGNANAWGNRWRAESGSVVFKVEAEDAYVNAYSRLQVPNVHYVPLKPDLSDLAAKTRWITDAAQAAELGRMAQRSADLAATFTYASEVRRVADELLRAWDGRCRATA
ncbi:hypothetical protein M885DRAFT_584445 [Pelagophyceae sp. CCMP2097]|nr:hypothetical protein M885DRAFT_584445 [Pelagophyceae sp. CCMP2097]